MSRSYKKPVYKDKGMKDAYWKRVRSRQKNEIKSGVHPEDVSNPKTIVNDYDYSDYSVGHNLIDKHEDELDDLDKKWKKKLERK